jgi:glycosyltransferase involved in cell wall biosynthesis
MFAYLFERFPSFVQTFVYREAGEMVRQGMGPRLISIRQPDDPAALAEHLEADIFYLPGEKELRAEVDRRRVAGQLARRAHRAIPRHRGESDSQRMFEAAWLAPVLKEAGIRHIHAHFGGLAARTAWWLRRLSGIPYSFTGHANDIFCETGFPVSNEQLVRDACFIVTETDYARHWMEEKYPFARGKVRRVFNGIALDGFPPRQPSGPIPRILSVGRYVEKKGFADLIEACRLLRAAGQEFECLIIGGGPLAETLQAAIDRADLGSSVKLLGPRPQGEVRRLLSEAQLFVLACVVEEGGGSDNLPTVIMEAMACGLPVVSTRVAGVPEMIADGEEGLLVPAHDPSALSAAILQVLRAPDLAERLGRRGREAAQAKFAVETTAAELKHLLIERAGVSIPPEALRFDPELGRLRRRGWFTRLFKPEV